TTACADSLSVDGKSRIAVKCRRLEYFSRLQALDERGGRDQLRSSGRVRQVGPPLPLMQSSLPGKVRTSNPERRNRSFVFWFCSRPSRRLLPSASTLQASVSRSE